MNNKPEVVFPKGMIVKKPHENAPDFIKLNFSFKVDEFIAFLQEHKKEDGWVNADLKKSKEGKLYVQLNNYVKGQAQRNFQQKEEDKQNEAQNEYNDATAEWDSF